MDKNEISRREFVRRSTGAGIALAAVALFPGARSSGRRDATVSASDRVTSGMIGSRDARLRGIRRCRCGSLCECGLRSRRLTSLQASA